MNLQALRRAVKKMDTRDCPGHERITFPIYCASICKHCGNAITSHTWDVEGCVQECVVCGKKKSNHTYLQGDHCEKICTKCGKAVYEHDYEEISPFVQRCSNCGKTKGSFGEHREISYTTMVLMEEFLKELKARISDGQFFYKADNKIIWLEATTSNLIFVLCDLYNRNEENIREALTKLAG